MHRTEPAPRIGPNAAIQLGLALADAFGPAAARHLFSTAGLAAWFDRPPQAMIAEADAARLHAAVWASLAPADAMATLAEAGRRTGAYILAHRIPRAAQWVLKALPAPVALHLLARAIAAHAWTFAGSGLFQAEKRQFCIRANPLAPRMPGAGCVWHAAVFETLLRSLVSRRATVAETACCSRGDPACVFVISLDAPQRGGRTARGIIPSRQVAARFPGH